MKKNKSSSPLIPIILILLVAGTVGSGYVWMNRDKYFPKKAETVTTEQPQIVQEQWRQDGKYYLITWEYPTSAGRTGKVGFKVSLNKDQIASADITILTTNEESKGYQEDFQKGLAKVVVGKKLSEIANIDIIGGASGTTKNFKAAVAALSAQLKI